MKFLSTLFLILGVSGASAADHVLINSLNQNQISKETTTLVRSNDQTTIQFFVKKLTTDEVTANGKQYQSVKVEGLNNTSNVGYAALPYYSQTLDSAVSDISISVKLGKPVLVKVGQVLPAQKELCRCDEDKKTAKVFVDHQRAWVTNSFYKIEDLGDFRGKKVSRVLFFPYHYNAHLGVIEFYPEAEFKVDSKPQRAVLDTSIYDYLVVSADSLKGAVNEWVNFKSERQDLKFKVVGLSEIGADANSAEKLKEWIHKEYNESRFRYALFVGSQKEIPVFFMKTTSSSQTPSDLPYFAMGGANDFIPDVHAGRIVASKSETVKNILKKWVAYEQDSSGSSQGWGRAIGVSSSEGSNPSDKEYVDSIQDKLNAKFGTERINFNEEDSNSTPVEFNKAMDVGSMWMTYLGHGSGTSWPSFNQTYSVSHIAQLQNANAVKPFWMDVACLNGKLFEDFAGAKLMSATDSKGNPTGTVAYYGGTVSISWHPPAILARGMAFSLVDMDSPTIGQVIQAGQKYLTENISNVEEIKSSQIWYVLQGDPSLKLRFK